MDAGRMDYLVVFEEPTKTKDGKGGTVTGWGNPVTADAAFRYLRGGETVQAARLSGRQPIVITVHSTSQTRAVTTKWRIRDLRSGEEFNIRAKAPNGNHQFLEFTVEGGVAV